MLNLSKLIRIFLASMLLAGLPMVASADDTPATAAPSIGSAATTATATQPCAMWGCPVMVAHSHAMRASMPQTTARTEVSVRVLAELQRQHAELLGANQKLAEDLEASDAQSAVVRAEKDLAEKDLEAAAGELHKWHARAAAIPQILRGRFDAEIGATDRPTPRKRRVRKVRPAAEEAE